MFFFFLQNTRGHTAHGRTKECMLNKYRVADTAKLGDSQSELRIKVEIEEDTLTGDRWNVYNSH